MLGFLNSVWDNIRFAAMRYGVPTHTIFSRRSTPTCSVCSQYDGVHSATVSSCVIRSICAVVDYAVNSPFFRWLVFRAIFMVYAIALLCVGGDGYVFGGVLIAVDLISIGWSFWFLYL